MKAFACLVVSAMGISGGLASPRNLASALNFDGKFRWVKLGPASPEAVRALSQGGSVTIELAFAHELRLKADKSAHIWFTFLLADQGSDWKWHQTSKYAAISAPGGVVKAGSHQISIPLSGIPKDVLTGKKQTLSLGAAASGISGSGSFSVVKILSR